jgi:hypothetical protein
MSRSTFLSRLALALLAVLGFVAPLAPERDRVVQTSGAGRPDQPEATPRALPATPPALPRTRPTEARRSIHPRPTPLITPHKYLLHRAWLH